MKMSTGSDGENEEEDKGGDEDEEVTWASYRERMKRKKSFSCGAIKEDWLWQN